MADKNKILVLASWYPSRVRPHLGTFVQRQTEAAARNVSMAALFVCSDPTMKKDFDIESKNINGVFTINVYYKVAGNPLQKGWKFFKAHNLGWKFALSHFGKPDMIHLNILWPAGIFAYYLKLFSGYKYIITENWTGYLNSNPVYQHSNAIKKYFTKRIAHNAEIVTPVSLDLKNSMQAHGLGSKFEIVYNAVDTSIFYPKAASKKNDKTTFLHVSTTLDEHKNVSGILKAVKILAEKRSDFILKIVSEADCSSHEKNAHDIGILNKYVFFENSKQANGIAEEMRKADCFVLFSNYENLPVVILEAMASGLPVISSTAGGVPEHINDDFGLLVQPRDTDSLCKAMDYMIGNLEKYDPVKIRNYAVKNFSCEAVSAQFETVYRKVIQ